MPESSRILELISALARGVSHRVRTPLSVISNDLQYYGTLLPAGEVDRSLAKVQQISGFLSDIGGLGTGKINQEPQDLMQIAKEIFPANWTYDSSIAPTRAVIEIDRALMKKCFGLCEDLFCKLESTKSPSLQQSRKCKIKAQAENLTLLHSLEVKPTFGGNLNFDSLTRLCCDCMGLDLPHPILIDAACWAHSARMQIDWNSNLDIAFTWSLTTGPR